MLVKSVIFLASAIVAAAASDPPGHNGEPDPLVPVCPECQPCAVDCLCSENHITGCSPTSPVKPPPKGPKNPEGRPVCAEFQPCKPGCICSTALMVPLGGGGPHGHQPSSGDDNSPHHPNIPQVRVCPEGQPCTSDCLCSWSNVLSFLNPNKLRPQTKICDTGSVNDTCLDRDALVDSLKAVLFPPKGTHVVDYFGDDKGDVKDEL